MQTFFFHLYDDAVGVGEEGLHAARENAIAEARQMMRWGLAVLVILSGCSTAPPQSDLQYIKQARSIAAEWALVNEQQRREGRLRRPTSVRCIAGCRTICEPSTSSLSEPDSRVTAGKSRRSSPSPRTLRRTSSGCTPASPQADRGPALNPLELTLGIMTAVGGFVDISELVFAATGRIHASAMR